MLKIALIYIAVMSIVSLLLYKIDKAKAVKHGWRIRESVLLLFGFFGGAVGALLGMKLFRHKTRHWYFWAVNILGLILQAAIVLIIIIK